MPTQVFYTISTAQDIAGEVYSPGNPTIAPDGSVGDANTHIYTGALTIGQPTKIKAMLVRNAGSYGPISSVYYSKLALGAAQAEPVVFNPGSKVGPLGSFVTTTMTSATPDVTIWYTLVDPGDFIEPIDGTGTPSLDAYSVVNGGSITVAVPTTIYARAIKTTAPTFIRSDLSSAVYDPDPGTLSIPACVWDPVVGTPTSIGSSVVFTVFNTAPGIQIWITTNSNSYIDPLDSNGNPQPYAQGPYVSGDTFVVVSATSPINLTARAIRAGSIAGDPGYAQLKSYGVNSPPEV